MKSSRFRTSAVAVAAAVALPVSLGVMAPQAFAENAAPSPSTSPSTSPAPSTSKPFGPGCASLAKSGAGSVAAMAKERLANAAATNPNLATLVSAVKKAGLTDTLNKIKDGTLFAPTNAAFAKVPKAQLDKLLSDKAALKKLLTYHVVGKKEITRAELPNGSFKTLEGAALKTTGSGTSFKVNKTANIVCGDIKTSNAVIYLVDGVLMPPS
ncbi:fasciclin domain-containing protein [Streptomyces sp. NPDC058220]|uniref:fasciclin domain-containing protein n=1 Tax=unclassified Streptomyces TaxID=2593676 RepID=UPI003668C826